VRCFKPTAFRLPRRLAVQAALLFLALFGLYMIGRPHTEVDCVPGPYTAWALVRHGSFDLSRYPRLERHVGGSKEHVLRPRPDGAWVSKYPLGTALTALPLVMPLALFRAEPLSSGGMRTLGKILGALYSAAAVAVFFLLCRRLLPQAWALPCVLLAWGTTLWSVAAQASWSHGPATLFVCLGMHLALAPAHPDDPQADHRSQGLAGLCFGLAILTRPTTILLGAAWGLVLLASGERKAVCRGALGAAGPVLALALHNLFLFGLAGIVGGGYEHEATDAWLIPNWTGLIGLLAAPSRGVLVYTPALLLLPWGVTAIARDRPGLAPFARRLLLAWLAAAGGTILLYSQRIHWWGGWSFGPRTLTETMPVLCLTAGFACASFTTALWRRAAGLLLLLSILIHALGVYGHDNAWRRRHADGASMMRLDDTQIVAHACRFWRRLTGAQADARAAPTSPPPAATPEAAEAPLLLPPATPAQPSGEP
jgi:hypothetical protein